MEKFEWSGKLETGIEPIDVQHKAIIEQCNKIADEIEQGRDESLIKKHLEFFLTYVNTHFSDEETFLGSISFPFLEKHQAEHERIRKRVTYFIDHNIDSNNNEFVNFVTHYWIHHILDYDFAYVKFYRNKEK